MNEDILDDKLAELFIRQPLLVGAERVLLLVNVIALVFVLYFFFSDNDWIEQFIILVIIITNIGYIYSCFTLMKERKELPLVWWKGLQFLGGIFAILGLFFTFVASSIIFILVGMNEDTITIMAGLVAYGFIHCYYSFYSFKFIRKRIRTSQ